MRPAPSKGERTRQLLIECAFTCLAHHGVKSTTFQLIANKSGYSQALVVRYFGTSEDIFPIVLDHYFSLAREKTRKALQKASKKRSSSAAHALKTYLRISAKIFSSTPEMQKFYVLLYGESVNTPLVRRLNQETREGAVNRIRSIIELGNSSGEFHAKSPEIAARLIHSQLTGLLLNWMLEKPDSRALQMAELERVVILNLVSQSRRPIGG